MGTRAENRQATLLRLGQAAVDLFEEQGSAATLGDITAEAGVSRRTVFRYVDEKEELAFVHPLLWLDVFDQALGRVDGFPVADRLMSAARAVASHVDADPGPPRRALLVVAANPELGRGFHPVGRQWADRVAAEVLTEATDPKSPSADERFRSRVIGSAMVGLVEAVNQEWVRSTDRTFSSLLEDGARQLLPLFDRQTTS